MSGGAPTSSLSRRAALRLGAGAVLAATAQAQDATEDLARSLREAARRGGAVRLRQGVTTIRSLELPDGATLIGGRGSTLRLQGVGPLLWAKDASRIALEGVTLDGSSGVIERDRGLVDFKNVARLSIHGCAIKNSSAQGIKLVRCGGVFAQNLIERADAAGYHSLDGFGVDIDGNHVRDCGDNGVLVWTSKPGAFEGSRVRNNLIEDVHNLSGGDGPYGNGVGIWRSGGVRVENNRIFRCAYTFVRDNEATDTLVESNDCKVCGERAMYAEFGAKRATFRNNRIEDAGAGVAVTNARSHGTDFGVVAGNTIVDLRERHPDGEFGAGMFWRTGVLGERNCEIAGNSVVGPAWIGIALAGWRENVRAEDNVIEGADYGIVFAVGEGVGEGMILRNRIRRSRKAAMTAFAYITPASGDLMAPSAKTDAFPRLVIRDNSLE